MKHSATCCSLHSTVLLFSDGYCLLILHTLGNLLSATFVQHVAKSRKIFYFWQHVAWLPATSCLVYESLYKIKVTTNVVGNMGVLNSYSPLPEVHWAVLAFTTAFTKSIGTVNTFIGYIYTTDSSSIPVGSILTTEAPLYSANNCFPASH